jgi:hypothetical protein
MLVLLVTQGQYYVTGRAHGEPPRAHHGEARAPSARAPRGTPSPRHGAARPLQEYDAKGRGRPRCHARLRGLPRDVQARHGARGGLGGIAHGCQRQVEPERHVGSMRASSGGLSSRPWGHSHCPRGAERGASPHGLLRRGARRGHRRVLPRQALRLAVRGVPRARRDARPAEGLPRQERRAPEGRHRRLPAAPRVRPALHGVARHRLRAAPRVRVRALPARPPRSAPPHPLLQRPAVGRTHSTCSRG